MSDGTSEQILLRLRVVCAGFRRRRRSLQARGKFVSASKPWTPMPFGAGSLCGAGRTHYEGVDVQSTVEWVRHLRKRLCYSMLSPRDERASVFELPDLTARHKSREWLQKPVTPVLPSHEVNHQEGLVSRKLPLDDGYIDQSSVSTLSIDETSLMPSDHGFAPLKNDLLLRTARNEPVPRAPCWAMRQAGRYLPQYHKEKGGRDFFDCCRSPEIASNLTIQPIDEFNGPNDEHVLLDAAIIFSDILVIPQALGMEVIMEDKKGPVFPKPLKSPADQQYMQVLTKKVDVQEELGYVFDAITLTRKKLKGRVPLYGFCGAPWTLLCYMVEGGGTKIFKEVKTWINQYGEQSKKLLQKLAEVCVDYLARQAEAGAQILQVFDSWAGELSPADFGEFALPYLRHIADKLPGRLKELECEIVPMTVFAKGAWYALEDLCKTNYDIIGLDWLHDPAEAYRLTQAHGKVVQGNLDPGVLYGSEANLRAKVEKMVDGFGKGKQGWICNLGHGVTPFVNKEMLRIFLEEVHTQCKL